MDRREFLQAATCTAFLLPALPAWARRRSINDYSGLDAVTVADERRPRSIEDVSAAVGEWPNAISVGGGRFSMGGQIAYPESLHLDMRQMNRVLALDPERRTVRVQAGISWRDLQEILKEHKVNALNVSIRHSPADRRSLLSWAHTDVFSFVLYHKQRTTGRARRHAEAWTRELIDATLEHGGRYYLTYRLHATPTQFVRAYPECEAFRRLKTRLDPGGKFQNMLWDRYLYLPASPLIEGDCRVRENRR
ncbi:MAG: FAD-binding protein [Gammaproteobacteria bacterium]|nr:FAD-binding protein [Gammaproteobacteria bacterium]